jgi:hypothetical protein
MYENGGPVTLCVKGIVSTAIDGIGPLLEVGVVDTMVARTNDSGLGGGIPPLVEILVGIEEFPEEVAAFVSLLHATLFGTRKDEYV